MNNKTTTTEVPRWLGWAIPVAAVLLLLLDVWVHSLKSFHPYFASEAWFGFYGWIGAGAAALVYLSSLGWGWCVRRSEGYYDE